MIREEALAYLYGARSDDELERRVAELREANQPVDAHWDGPNGSWLVTEGYGNKVT
jgi:hypothetical protein